MRIVITFALTLTTLAGCLTDGDGRTMPEAGDPVHVLLDTVEPEELLAPTFTPLGAIASGGPVYGAGEPSVWATLDGMLYVAFPGCDRAFYLVGLPTDTESCGHGLVYASEDDGAGWVRLNRDGDGRYSDDGPAANGDADVAVDSAGTLYASNLGGGGIQLHSLYVNGTWSYLGNVVPPTENEDDDPEQREGADRQWLAAAGPGHVINTWMRTSPERDVAINTTFDGGETWTGTSYFGDGIGWLGTVQFAPDGQHAYIPYTQPQGDAVEPALGGGQTCAMHVIRTADGGRTWEDIDTGARWQTTLTGTHWSCVHMAPALDVTGDGTVVVTYSRDAGIGEDVLPQANVVPAAQTLHVLTSQDGGATWTGPTQLTAWQELPGGASIEASAIMPWVTGGAGDRYAITYLQTLTTGDQDYTATRWNVAAFVVDGDASEPANIVHAIVEQNVHAGGICTRGGACLLTGSDRAFLDFFESDLLPDGRLVVTYPHDLNPTKMIEIRVAIQSGGTPLLEPA